MQWKRPYEGIERVEINDYRVKIGGNRKLFHVNMMKKYSDRSDVEIVGLAAIVEEQPECETEEDYPFFLRGQKISGTSM